MKLPFSIPFFNKKPGTYQTPRPNKLLSFLLMPWQYGRALWSERDFHRMLLAYKSWVYVCSSRNAQGVAQANLRLYVAKPSKQTKITRFATAEVHSDTREYIKSNASIQRLDAVRKAADFEEITDHPILNLLRNVNPYMNAFDLWEYTTLYQELVGNAYWLLVTRNEFGRPDEIWPIPADKIMIVPDSKKFIQCYRYVRYYGNTNDALTTFREDEIIHFKYPNPRSLYYGVSPLVAINAAYNINEFINEYETAIFQNMGKLEGAFETENSLDEEEFERLKTELSDAYFGARNAGKSPLLENGVTYKQYGYSPREMSYKEGRMKIKEEIFNAYGVPLGLYEHTANRANSDAAIYNWAKHALKPRCMRMEQKLNEKLTPRYDTSLFLMFDDVVPEDIELAMKVRESNLTIGLTSRDEERKKMRMDPLPDKTGAEPMMQVQYAPLSILMSDKHPLNGANLNSIPQDNGKKPSSSKPKEEQATNSKKGLDIDEDELEDFVETVVERFYERTTRPKRKDSLL